MEDEKPKDEKPRRWGVVCAAFQCEAKKEKKADGGINFHQFPITNPDLCDTWVKQCRIDFTPTTHHRLCGNHFRDEDYKTSKRSHLKDGAIPSIFSWTRKQPESRVLPGLSVF